MVKKGVSSPGDLKDVSGSANLYGGNILTRTTKKQDLINYLEELQKSLMELEQDTLKAPKGLSTTANQLISPKILEHPDKEIRVLAANCVVDVLRIYAPEAPYKDDDMIRVFSCLLQQIRGLETHSSTSPQGKRMVYILNSLATVKSCVVPVIMEQQGIAGAADVMQTMFNTFLNIINPDTAEEGNHRC